MLFSPLVIISQKTLNFASKLVIFSVVKRIEMCYQNLAIRQKM